MEEPSRLIALSVESIRRAPFLRPDGSFAQLAVICGKSSTNDLSFKIETGLLSVELAERCEVLREHGFTVVEAPNDWRYDYRSPGEWQEVMIQQAMKQVALLETCDGERLMSAYDADLARAVLKAVNNSFPNQLSMIELKHELRPEPSDDALLTALEGLLIERLAEGSQLRAGNKLYDMARIRITAEGRSRLESRTSAPVSPNGPVIHGDQIINYGQAGAIGRESQGAINIYEHWKEIERETDLEMLAVELERLRAEYRKLALSREDDKQVALLGDAAEEAEKGNGRGVAAILSRAREGVLNVAKDIGTDIVAKVIVELTKPD